MEPLELQTANEMPLTITVGANVPASLLSACARERRARESAAPGEVDGS